MISTNQFKNGMTIVVAETLYTIVEFQHVKPGKGGAFVRTKLRNLRTGGVVDKTFRAGEKFDQAMVERRPMQFLYQDGSTIHLMDTQNYEQIELDESLAAGGMGYIKENMILQMMTIDGEPTGIEAPNFVELEVAQADPGLKGDSATSGTKPATLETGAVIQVPLFVNPGDVVKVDTRTGTYIERA